MAAPSGSSPQSNSRKARQNATRLLDNPQITRQLSTALVLVALIILVRAPLQFGGSFEQWINVWGNEAIQLQPQFKEVPEPSAEEGGIVSRFANDVVVVEEKEETPGEQTGKNEAQTQQSRAIDIKRVDQQPALEFAEIQPQIAGGLKNLYLRINYPADALAAGIEGRTVLLFVVEPDGSPSDIQVEQSLYPSCDSAAVAAVRETLFVPGQQNGEIVRVKMRLPVRFKLLEPQASTQDSTSASDK